jgi:TetR/AcrR family transcriptional regulator, transcriptional repressor for nem operon
MEDLMAARRGHDNDAGTASRILDVAEHLVQVRGFNGFSYADIAAELRITKAALHYHFAGKADLGEALITRYAGRFADALAGVGAGGDDASTKLAAYADLYLQVLRDRRMCLCGMLAAEYQTLPEPMRDAVIKFFDQNETWLENVLAQGREDGSLQFAGSARDTARMVVGGLEGAMLVARPYGDIARFQAAAANLLAGLAPRETAQVDRRLPVGVSGDAGAGAGTGPGAGWPV